MALAAVAVRSKAVVLLSSIHCSVVSKCMAVCVCMVLVCGVVVLHVWSSDHLINIRRRLLDFRYVFLL